MWRIFVEVVIVVSAIASLIFVIKTFRDARNQPKQQQPQEEPEKEE